MANGFAAKDAAGLTVTILSQQIAHTALGITGQAQVNLIVDGVGGQNLLQVDSNGAAIVAPLRSGTATKTNVSAVTTSATLLAANASRRGASVYNDSSSAMYVNLGASATTSAFVIKLAPASYFEIPFEYTGTVNGVWDTATGSARVTEFTA